MKKIVLAALLVTLATGSFAQNFRFGLQGSGALSWMKPDTKGIESNGIKLASNYGIMTDFAVGDENYYLSTGLSIATIGGKLKYPDLAYPIADSVSIFANGTTSDNYSLNYVEIPILLKMRTNEIGYLRYFGQFGLGAGVNTKARRAFKTSYGSNNLSDEDLDISSDVRLVRMGLIIGLGAEYNLTGNTNAMVSINYNNGFTNVFNRKYYELDESDNTVVLNDDGITPKAGPRWKAVSNYLSVTVGIFF